MTVEASQQMNNEKRNKKWNWIGLIWKLCDGDITKVNYIVSLPFTQCLIWLSYEKEMKG